MIVNAVIAIVTNQFAHIAYHIMVLMKLLFAHDVVIASAEVVMQIIHNVHHV